MTMEIQKIIYVKPEYLHDYESYIKSQLEIIKEKDCNKNYGYIININKINKIEMEKINQDGYVIYNVFINIENILPKIDDIFKVKIIHIFNEGIFCKLINKINIIIPKKKIEEQGIEFINNTYNNYKINDEIDIKITNVRYTNNKIDCIGNLII